MCAKANSKVTHKNGAPTQARNRLRCANRRTDHANVPVKMPKTVAIRSRIAQPPTRERPPCTASTVAIHDIEVKTKKSAWTPARASPSRAGVQNYDQQQADAEPGVDGEIKSGVGER